MGISSYKIGLKLFIVLCFSALSAQSEGVNAIIGDQAWYATHGYYPHSDIADQLRVRNHLEYVLDLLSQTEVDEPLQAKRKVLLRFLKDYIDKGKFPRNFYFPSQRRPCFIDDEGRYCAVGYLVAQSAGKELALAINKAYRFHYLLDIKDPALKRWQEQSGFSMRELAMIQPSYRTPIPIASRYYLYQSPSTHKYGLKETETHKVALRARYSVLRYDPSAVFIWAKKGQDWYLFDSVLKPLPRDYGLFQDTYDSLRFIAGQDQAMLCFRKKEIILILADGSVQGPLKIDFQAIKLVPDHILVKVNGMWQAYNYQWQALFKEEKQHIEALLAIDGRFLGFKAQIHGNWTFYGTKGEYISGPWQDLSVYRGMIKGRSKEGQDYLLSSAGDTLANEVSELEAVSGHWLTKLKQEGGYALINGYNGICYSQYPYQEMHSVSNFKLKVKRDSAWGLIDYGGTELIPCKYQAIYPEGELFLVKDQEGMGVFDSQGKTLIPCLNDTAGLWLKDAGDPRKQIMFVQKGGERRYYHQDGREIFGIPDYDEQQFLSQAHKFLKNEQSAWIVQSLYGDLQIDSADIESLYFLGSYLFAYEQDGKFGVLLAYPKNRLATFFRKEAQWDSIVLAEHDQYNFFVVEQDGLWGIYDFRRDNLIIDTQFEDFFIYGINRSYPWIYFKGEDRWHGFTHTAGQLTHIRDDIQPKIQAWYEEELLRRRDN